MIDLSLPVLKEPVKRCFRIPGDLSDEFELYVEAARQKEPAADESVVLEAILRSHLKRDRGFRSWLQKRRRAQKQEDSGMAGQHSSTNGYGQ
ncbi:hypothetical protein Paes_2356 (plasmid) [Prosthecochloris aestuarii DSM 271]|uniref:Uncharacterized protein n=1 Tax=Prosthecochloris aestuarii (strain DSM 271 / SK 413) TaxID=290512 RepID=B4S9M0_PROA2|nr:DUF2274 domain-containing protein [Prosthecochloris aestuarii]ACF47347.1 hypothetical protein Paes_2356 [Prosthecochloris aestuarii DSM 271]